MLLGMCLAAYGDCDLPTALYWADGYGGEVHLDVPTDTTSGLVDAGRCATDARYRDDCAEALRGRPIGCLSNSRDAQLLLGPHGPHTDPVCTGDANDKRAHAVMCATGTIRLAERIGAPTVRLLPGCPDFGRWLSWWNSDVSWADNIAECRNVLEPLVHAAREAGVRLLIEPHPKHVVYDRASAEQLFDACAEWADVIGLCVDPANFAATGHDPVDAVRAWGPRMVAVHVKDVQTWQGRGMPTGAGWSRYGPQPPIRFRALGLGDLNWPAIIAALQDEGFEGVLYLEHEDVLLPRGQSLDRGMRHLRSMVPARPAEGRTW